MTESTPSELITFADSLNALPLGTYKRQILHLLCLEGSMSFSYQNKSCLLQEHQYAIFPYAQLLEDTVASAGFKCLALLLDHKFTKQLPLRSTYGIIGHLSLLQNPIIPLSDSAYESCLFDLKRLKIRLCQQDHLFYCELIDHLLCAHILDLYDLHARSHQYSEQPGSSARLMAGFISLLEQGSFKQERSVSFYADKLHVSAHYLSEVSRELSGNAASYWIEHYTLQEIMLLLCRPDLSLTKIADKLNFSDLSYFSRFFSRHLGISPRTYRNRRLKQTCGSAAQSPCTNT